MKYQKEKTLPLKKIYSNYSELPHKDLIGLT